ncbi:hypothetical protein BXZ70DRAFT_1080840 [Cristinia sonorae]|uniref:Uncharacterized protein n=1 Tax=Cristinia sonorae TaxID=1940300 RepID=A0A8K0UG78_9AGAR|nr:hypothetical protein BXZ70DRAFT_1080840 [Cristinia sonorae]
MCRWITGRGTLWRRPRGDSEIRNRAVMRKRVPHGSWLTATRSKQNLQCKERRIKPRRRATSVDRTIQYHAAQCKVNKFCIAKSEVQVNMCVWIGGGDPNHIEIHVSNHVGSPCHLGLPPWSRPRRLLEVHVPPVTMVANPRKAVRKMDNPTGTAMRVLRNESEEVLQDCEELGTHSLYFALLPTQSYNIFPQFPVCIMSQADNDIASMGDAAQAPATFEVLR